MSNQDKLIVVAGATGQQGGATVRHLLAKGFQVRGLTRDTSKPAAQALVAAGAEIAQADNDDAAALAAALKGAYGVFAVQGFWEQGIDAETRQGKLIADVAKAAGVQHFVYTSVGGADRESGVPHFESKWAVEEHIRAIGIPATILRPVEFMENLFWSREGILNGAFVSVVRPERKKYYIAVDDIGVFAALVFEHPEQYIGQAFEIAGDALTEAEIAETLTRVTGRPVQVVNPPKSEAEAFALSEDLQAMWRWFDEHGYQSDIEGLRKLHPALKTLETWLHQTGWAQPAAVNAK